MVGSEWMIHAMTQTVRPILHGGAARRLVCTCLLAVFVGSGAAWAQGPEITGGIEPPADYVIGPDDVLTVVFWREKDMSGDVTVRPDGRITLPLVNELHAAGLTPEELRVAIDEAASKYIEDPTATVQIKQINSRRVYITGMVARGGPYVLSGPMTVLQLIATAGGVLDWANEKNISIMRVENGTTRSIRFNYHDVRRGRNLHQNIELKPGDTVIVP
jgi:polysaccharide biosynthesis/export protein